MTALLRTALPITAIIAFVATTGAVLASAGSTLGYDYQAYVGAAGRFLDGLPLYDQAVDVAGGFAIFLYPPPFAIALIPFAALSEQAGIWAWEALVIGSFLLGVAVLPTSRTVRWLILLLGALDWPVLYSFKLGQVGPLLFMLFAMGWRWRDRPGLLGASMAAGALIKVQPVLLLAWAALTGRWRAALIALGVMAASALVATAVFGPATWSEYIALLARVSAPVTTPHNFTPGAIAFQAGMTEDAATILQLVATVGVLGVTILAIRLASAEVSFLAAVVASQLLSPLLWDHYAIVLLLPTAWLLERGQWWAVAIPLLTALPLVGVVPAAVYPLVFSVGLIAPTVVELVRGQDHHGVDSWPRAAGAA